MTTQKALKYSVFFLFFLGCALFSVGWAQTGDVLYSHLDQFRVRLDPDRDSRQIGTLKEGEAVTFFGKRSKSTEKISLRGVNYEEPWLKVKMNNGMNGWVYAGGLKFYKPGETTSPAGITLYTSVDNLRLRKEPTTKGEIIGELPLGKAVIFEGKVTAKRDRFSMGGVYYDEPWVYVSVEGMKSGWTYAGGLKVYPTTDEQPVTASRSAGTDTGRFDWEAVRSRCRYENLQIFRLEPKYNDAVWEPYYFTPEQRQYFIPQINQFDHNITVSTQTDPAFDAPVNWQSWEGRKDGFVWVTAMNVDKFYRSRLYLMKLTEVGVLEDCWVVAEIQMEGDWLQEDYSYLANGFLYRTTVEEISGEETTTQTKWKLMPGGEFQEIPR